MEFTIFSLQNQQALQVHYSMHKSHYVSLIVPPYTTFPTFSLQNAFFSAHLCLKDIFFILPHNDNMLQLYCHY